MTRNDVAEAVGPERYNRECKLAYADATREDYGRGAGAELELPHVIEEMIWESGSEWRDRIDLFFAIYEDMPCYSHLMYAKHQYGYFDVVDRDHWWRRVQHLLNREDAALRRPLTYALWCDFFEDDATVKDAWEALTGEGVPSAVVGEALRCSGPVPYELKAPVYERLVSDPDWHDDIAESLFWSSVDVYGKVDRTAARKLVRRLKPSISRLPELRERLT